VKNLIRSVFGRKNAPAPAESAAIVRPAEGVKVLGTKQAPVKKVLAITGLEVKAEGEVVRIKGYANTKGSADRYGDVPTVFTQLRAYVYELADFRKNPVMLIDHMNSVGYIAGSFSALKEDENGLFFEAEFSKSSYPLVAHARTVYAEGHGKALSIAGRWYFEDKDHPERLTYAEIFEISLVGVGADPNALAAAEQPAPKTAPAAPCCYRHAGGMQKELACASLEQVNIESTELEAAAALKKDLEDSALAAEITRFLQTQGA
jgi:phage head maturation protease